jgi:threonine dehydrogenase-like Zn-dependent dehydrogenase
MHQLMFESPGEYAWREAPEPPITAPEQAIVRPLAVACCDLDVAVAEGRLPMPPGHGWDMRASGRSWPSAMPFAT